MRKNHTYELHMMMCGCRMLNSQACKMTGYDGLLCCA